MCFEFDLTLYCGVLAGSTRCLCVYLVGALHLFVLLFKHFDLLLFGWCNWLWCYACFLLFGCLLEWLVWLRVLFS